MSKEEGAYARYKVLAVNDEKDFCQCCGKKSLKKVVWIEDEETGQVQHFGTICALHPNKSFGLDREIKLAIQKHENRTKAITMMTHVEYRKAGGKYTQTSSFSSRPSDLALFQSMRERVTRTQSARI